VIITTVVSGCFNGALPSEQVSTPPAGTGARLAYPEMAGLDASGLRSVTGEGKDIPIIRYRLSEKGLVRLRLVDKSTPGIILITLLDWARRDAGVNTETWNGRDRKGGYPDPLRISVAAVVEPDRNALSESERQALSSLHRPEHKHFLHPIDLCGDLIVRINSPLEGSNLSGVANIEAELAGRPGIPDPEYHVVVYVDGRNAWDGRVTEPRLRAPFDTRNIPNGEHTVAVTFNDLHDHAGSDWLVVVIDNQ
jgi:hypothetical protein